jgi:cytochrome c-type biogenesis protein CcmF
MSGQLLVFLFIFIILSVVMLAIRWKELPRSRKDEEAYTREFWMFIGSLVLTISAFQIILTTSIPVFNKVFGYNLAPPSDVIAHYNKWQMPLAIIVALLTGVGQLLKYKTNTKRALVKILTHIAVAIIISVALMFLFELHHWFYVGLMFASVFAISANCAAMVPYVTGKIKMAGSHVAHIGFGILLVGVLVSSVNKRVISLNQSGMQLNPEFDAQANMEHVFLERGKPLRMDEYEIEYKSDTVEWVNHYYQVRYKKINSKTNEVAYEFDLYPNAQINPKMGLVANPDTKHYFSHDVFTYVSSVPKEKASKFVHEQLHEVKPGDTIYTNNGYAVLEQVNSNAKDANTDVKNLSLLIAAELKVHALNGIYQATPMYGIRDNAEVKFESIVEEARLRFRFIGVNPKNRTITIETAEQDTSGDFIIMKAIVFPWINLVWAGTIIMIIGFMLAIVRRVSENRRNAVVE